VYIWCMTNNDASTLQNMHQPEVMYVHVWTLRRNLPWQV
jgi:hypothetical protein